MPDDLFSLCAKAVERVRSLPKGTRIRIVSHYDADGIAAAGVLCNALYEKGYEFHASLMRNPFTNGLYRLLEEENDFIIFSDMGSGQIETIEKLKCPVIILDHHQYLKKDVKQSIVQINANLCGLDGNYDACGATLSYAFAVELDKTNEWLAPLALAGATGDKQYIGGIRGYNKQIAENAVKNGFLKPTTGLKLAGEALADALYYSIDPYFKGISGKKKEITEFLKKLGIDGKKKPSELTEQEKQQLHSFLLLALLKANCQADIIDTVIRDRYWSDMLGCELERFADLLDACGKNGHRSLGLSLCLGGSKVFDEAEKVEKEYKQKILDALHGLETDGIHELKAIRYFYSDNSSLGGVIGGIAMNFIFDEKKPLFSLARKPDELHVSCRGNQLLVKQGLDLGSAMKTIAEELGGNGGGHKIASGATIGVDKEQSFLERTDQIIGEQLQV